MNEYDWLTESGYFANDPRQGGQGGVVTNTGRPDTQAEMAFINDYLSQYGARPTNEMVLQGTANAPREYIPGSTMHEMGFRNWDEYLASQSQGQPYGPWSGDLVPFGSMVTTDETGKPSRRFYGNEREGELPMLSEALKEGRYVQQPGYVPSRINPEVPSRGQVAPETVYPDMPPPKPYSGPTLDYRGAAKGMINNWLDSFEPLLEQDLSPQEIAKQGIDLLSGKLNDPNIDPVSRQALFQLGSALASASAVDGTDLLQAVTQAVKSIGSYIAAQDPSVGRQRAAAEQTGWEARMPNQAAPFKPNYGNEQAEYAQWVGTLGVSNVIQEWLFDNYYRIYQVWQKEGRGMPFAQFAERYLGGQ